VAARTLSAVRATSALRRGGWAVIPVERLRVTVAGEPGRLLADVRKDVIAIVVVSPDGIRALGPSGEPVDLDPLRAVAVGLGEQLSA
jgi:hypothetical protein